MYFHRTPRWIQALLPQITWKIPSEEKILYLTFDDGPDSLITPKVLACLDRYGAKASFFCIGKKALKEQGLLEEIRRAGHTIGNHTFSHPNGWKVSSAQYLEEIEKCHQIIGGNLFRPPYGKITPKQLKAVHPTYKVVLWDILSGDFDASLSKEKAWQKIIKYTEKGSILVFHDTQKASEKLLYILPKLLSYYSKQGYAFHAIPE